MISTIVVALSMQAYLGSAEFSINVQRKLFSIEDADEAFRYLEEDLLRLGTKIDDSFSNASTINSNVYIDLDNGDYSSFNHHNNGYQDSITFRAATLNADGTVSGTEEVSLWVDSTNTLYKTSTLRDTSGTVDTSETYILMENVQRFDFEFGLSRTFGEDDMYGALNYPDGMEASNFADDQGLLTITDDDGWVTFKDFTDGGTNTVRISPETFILEKGAKYSVDLDYRVNTDFFNSIANNDKIKLIIRNSSGDQVPGTDNYYIMGGAPDSTYSIPQFILSPTQSINDAHLCLSFELYSTNADGEISFSNIVVRKQSKSTYSWVNLFTTSLTGIQNKLNARVMRLTLTIEHGSQSRTYAKIVPIRFNGRIGD